jgi:aryl sulfotransferase
LWNDFPFRDDDIIIGTYAKSGTTCLQQMVSQLIFNGRTDINVAELSLWIDMVVPPREIKFPAIEAQTHRRFLKTHLPVDALVYSPQAKYIYIARDGRDVLWSFYHHHSTFNKEGYAAINNSCSPDVEKLQPPQHDIYEYFHEWLDRDGYPLWSFWENISSWWKIRDLPNMKLMHFSALKADMPGQIREIDTYLNIPIDENKWDESIAVSII